MKRTALKRKAPLKRSGRLKQTRKRKHASPAKDHFDRTVLQMVVLPDGEEKPTADCIVCGMRAQDAHHACPKSRLYDTARALNFNEDETAALVMDPRCGVPVCRLCHSRHESASQRIPRERLPDAVWEFAAYVDRLVGTQALRQRLIAEYPAEGL